MEEMTIYGHLVQNKSDYGLVATEPWGCDSDLTHFKVWDIKFHRDCTVQAIKRYTLEERCTVSFDGKQAWAKIGDHAVFLAGEAVMGSYKKDYPFSEYRLIDHVTGKVTVAA